MNAERRRRILKRVVAVAAVLMLLYVVVVFVQVTRAANDSVAATATGDAIVVLGAAQYNGEPSPVLESRLRTALGLWRDDAAALIVTTGANRPGDTFTEGFAGFRYLRNQGVGEDEIIVITDGGDTYESLLATINQLRRSGLVGSVVLVTDAYHALRSAEIAREVGLDPVVVAAGDDTRLSRRLRETAAVSLGRIIGYRRLSGLR